jgi:uncharacterized glyoxalase superfamily protein PhnB
MIVLSLRYRDAPAAIAWLKEAFGFEESMVVGDEEGGIAHAQLTYGDGMVMLGSAREDAFGDHVGQGWAYVVVDDADAHRARAVAAGAEVVRPLEDQEYGSRDYSARDPEGNLWSFGTYDPRISG